jgi:hypothetical protein
MNFNAGEETREMRAEPCQEQEFFVPQPVIETVHEDGLETGAGEYGFQRGTRGGITLEYHLNFFFKGFKHNFMY